MINPNLILNTKLFNKNKLNSSIYYDFFFITFKFKRIIDNIFCVYFQNNLFQNSFICSIYLSPFCFPYLFVVEVPGNLYRVNVLNIHIYIYLYSIYICCRGNSTRNLPDFPLFMNQHKFYLVQEQKKNSWYNLIFCLIWQETEIYFSVCKMRQVICYFVVFSFSFSKSNLSHS